MVHTSAFEIIVPMLRCSFFFFKQKTAYEMRISDWSSDVCSSDLEAVANDPVGIALKMAQRFNAIILLKGPRSFVVDPDGHVLVHTGGCVGLATGGSGDVLAGIVGGLAARGAISATASAWGAWVHGRAGEMLTDQFGRVVFLARGILPLIPPLLDSSRAG